MSIQSRVPIDIAEVTGTTTYAGHFRLYWINIHATVNSTVTISDASKELMSIYVPADTSEFIKFRPTINCSTSIVLTKSAGTCKITSARAGM